MRDAAAAHSVRAAASVRPGHYPQTAAEATPLLRRPFTRNVQEQNPPVRGERMP